MNKKIKIISEFKKWDYYIWYFSHGYELKKKKWISYGQNDSVINSNSKPYFFNIYPSPHTVKLCYCDGKYYKLEFDLHSNQSEKDMKRAVDYHGWLDFENNVLRHVWGSRGQTAMCFPYGSKTEEEKGSGILLRLKLISFEEFKFKGKKWKISFILEIEYYE